MAIIPYPDPASLTEEAKAILGEKPQNLARMLAGSGELFKPLLEFSMAYFRRGVLPPATRECVTCRIAARYNAQYVLKEHEKMARRAGITDEQWRALLGPLPSSAFSDRDNAALLLVDALIEQPRAPEELVLNAYELLGETAFHELLIVSGFYHMVVRYTEPLRIDLDEGPTGSA